MDVKVKFADHTIKVEKVGELGTNKVLMVSREGGSSGGSKIEQMEINNRLSTTSTITGSGEVNS